jgi:ABC-2 type transport system ATP-binding protein
VVRTRNDAAAMDVLRGKGWSPALGPEGAIEVNDRAAIERPDDAATRLVEAGYPPTALVVEEEDLEHYFLRLVGLGAGGAP